MSACFQMEEETMDSNLSAAEASVAQSQGDGKTPSSPILSSLLQVRPRFVLKR